MKNRLAQIFAQSGRAKPDPVTPFPASQLPAVKK
jgi:hypothetical protein